MLTFILEQGAVLNSRTQLFKECVDFWIREGKTEYDKLKPTIKFPNGNSMPLPYDSYIMERLMIDAKVCFNDNSDDKVKASILFPKNIKFEFGNGGNHIWVHENNVRTVLVTFN